MGPAVPPTPAAPNITVNIYQHTSGGASGSTGGNVVFLAFAGRQVFFLDALADAVAGVMRLLQTLVQQHPQQDQQQATSATEPPEADEGEDPEPAKKKKRVGGKKAQPGKKPKK